MDNTAVVCFNTWAGRVEIKVKVLDRTLTIKRHGKPREQYRVECLEDFDMRGWKAGDIKRVPAYAVRMTKGIGPHG